MTADARACFEAAYQRQQAGDLDGAISLYRQSLELDPTAEAHTFLGWTYSLQGRWEEAIRECLNAIRVEPSYGNPYNDIGAYLIELGRVDEAIPWLEKAIAAPRYANRAFPHLNLGRVYERKGQWTQALAAYRQALGVDPQDADAAQAISRLSAQWN